MNTLNSLIVKDVREGLTPTESAKTHSFRLSITTKKAFGESRGLRGAALTRAYADFKHDSARKLGGEIARLVTEGEIHPTAMSQIPK